MELRQENLCCHYDDNFCAKNMQSENQRDCIFNSIIYEDDIKILFYNHPDKQIFKISKGEGLQELDFKSAIREIDIIPAKTSEWKKKCILKLAKDLGFFGI